jgi:hypothetical protein
MNVARLTDFEIRTLGWQALIDRLGPAGALRFAIQTERGFGDYAQLRHRHLGGLSVDELVARAKNHTRSARSTQTKRRGA